VLFLLSVEFARLGSCLVPEKFEFQPLPESPPVFSPPPQTTSRQPTSSPAPIRLAYRIVQELVQQKLGELRLCWSAFGQLADAIHTDRRRRIRRKTYMCRRKIAEFMMKIGFLSV
jgi:hypothetical protein